MRGVEGSVIRQVGQRVEEGAELRVGFHQVEPLIFGFAVAVAVEGCDDVVHGVGCRCPHIVMGFVPSVNYPAK